MEKIRKPDGFENQYLFVLQPEIVQEHLDNPVFSALRVTDIGFFPHAQYHFRSREKGCEETILLLCIAGRGHYRVGTGEAKALSAGQAVLIPKGTRHEYAADDREPWSVYWLHMVGPAAEAYCGMAAPHQPIRLDRESREEAIRLFHRCFELLKKPWQAEEYAVVCQNAGLVAALLCAAGRQAGLQLTVKGGRAIADATDFMKENLHRSLTLAEIAAASHFSASHLHALFKASTGYAPVEYFLRMKVQAAGKQLYFTDKAIKEIAADFGIEDSCYFSRLFKRIMGMPPLEYRNLMKG